MSQYFNILIRQSPQDNGQSGNNIFHCTNYIRGFLDKWFNREINTIAVVIHAMSLYVTESESRPP